MGMGSISLWQLEKYGKHYLSQVTKISVICDTSY